MVGERVGFGRTAERLQRAHATPYQVGNRLSDQTAGQRVGLPGLDAHRCQQHRIGTDRGGGKAPRARHRAGRRIERVADARGFGLIRSWRLIVRCARGSRRDRNRDLPARAPLQHHHREPGFLLELRIGKVVVAAERRRIDLPEHAPAGVLGQLLETFEPQWRDACGHYALGPP